VKKDSMDRELIKATVSCHSPAWRWDGLPGNHDFKNVQSERRVAKHVHEYEAEQTCITKHWRRVGDELRRKSCKRMRRSR
jgi:hypothetical protein